MTPSPATMSSPACRFQGVRLLAFSLSLVMVTSACDRPANSSESPSTGSGSAMASGGSGVPAEGDAPNEASAAEAPVVPSSTADVAEEAAPIELESLLRRAGFEPGDEIEVYEFVPVPPGATASAATFGRGTLEARIVAVNYPNPQYARPHVTDVLERRALLPTGGDAVLARGSQVIQLRLLEREAADALADELRVLLQWPELVDPALLPPAR